VELQDENKERLIRYIDFMKAELSDFSKSSKVDWKTFSGDRDTRRNLERWLENKKNRNSIIQLILDFSSAYTHPTINGIIEIIEGFRQFFLSLLPLYYLDPVSKTH
jgi:hypothetical protein